MVAATRRYETDLTDQEWERIREVVTRRSRLGRPREVDLPEVVNALLYVDRTGCQWRLLPKDFPHRSTVRYYFDLWTHDHRLAKDYEHSCRYSESWVYLASIQRMIRRIDRTPAVNVPDQAVA